MLPDASKLSLPANVRRGQRKARRRGRAKQDGDGAFREYDGPESLLSADELNAAARDHYRAMYEELDGQTLSLDFDD